MGFNIKDYNPQFLDIEILFKAKGGSSNIYLVEYDKVRDGNDQLIGDKEAVMEYIINIIS